MYRPASGIAIIIGRKKNRVVDDKDVWISNTSCFDKGFSVVHLQIYVYMYVYVLYIAWTDKQKQPLKVINRLNEIPLQLYYKQ